MRACGCCDDGDVSRALEGVADDGCSAVSVVGVDGFAISVCEPGEVVVDVALEPVFVGCAFLWDDVDGCSFGEFVNVVGELVSVGSGGGECVEWSCCHVVAFLFLPCFVCCSRARVRVSVSRLRYHVLVLLSWRACLPFFCRAVILPGRGLPGARCRLFRVRLYHMSCLLFLCFACFWRVRRAFLVV